MRSSARWTCPPAADRRPRRLGLSLLELLVAIAIVAAIAAVALPWTWNRLNRATLPETADRIAAVLLLARAEAMRSGRLVEVRSTLQATPATPATLATWSTSDVPDP
jgi:prepilin-type N-terminal cleavage/methylation domain-containing protein